MLNYSHPLTSMYYADNHRFAQSDLCQTFPLLNQRGRQKLTQVWHARVLSVAVTSFADHVYLIAP